jgi:hypothetical protein
MKDEVAEAKGGRGISEDWRCGRAPATKISRGHGAPDLLV